MKKHRFRLSPARWISLGFFLVILAGTGLLLLPVASKGEPVGFLDALFTATSATCVTGLIVRDTFTGWTVFGQAVILCLIQLGGLGFMTVITMISYALGKHLGLYNRKILMQSAGNVSLSGVGSLIRRIVPFTFLFELGGAALLSIRMIPKFGWLRGIWFSVFHSVSAFCNAGFDLMGAEAPYSSLTAFTTDPLVTLTVSLLIIIGGLGFLVWRDLFQNGLHWSKYQLHTKLVIATTAVLLVGSGVLFLILESNASLEGMPLGEKLLASFFQSVTPRTAGFNTVDLNAMSEGGNVLTNVLMLIGGSPGSTAGGIKTTTVAVLLLSTIASARGRTRVIAFRYSIDRDMIRQACSVVCLYLLMAITAVIAVCALDPVTVKQAMFEVNSAIATVGLTLGITPTLSAASRVILILLMYAGRIGVLTFILVFSERRTEPPVDRPNGKLLIG
ncbi:MAG: Trk family potassium uptake protein [Clostridiales bacterium]|nr:Trk family potassium uptake protein [Clostridiales bacterium]